MPRCGGRRRLHPALPARMLQRMERQGPDSRKIILHRPEDFEPMRRAGQLAAACLDMITAYVVPGITTGQLDRLIHEYLLDHGATPATLGYRGYTKSCCIRSATSFVTASRAIAC